MMLNLFIYLVLPSTMLGSLGMVYWGLTTYNEIQQLLQNGQAGQAEVIQKSIYDDQEGKIIYRIHYQVKDNPKAQRENVAESLYQRYELQDSIPIIYLANRPQVARLKENGLSYRMSINRIIFGLLMAIFCAWLFYRLLK